MFRPRACYCVLCAMIGLALAVLYLFGSTPAVFAQGGPKGPVSFINDVAPILKENCFACHDSKKRKGKLDMTTYETFRKGGSKDDPIEAGKRLANYLAVLTLECQTIARANGKSHVHNLEPEDLVALTVEAAAMAQVPLAGTDWIPGRAKG